MELISCPDGVVGTLPSASSSTGTNQGGATTPGFDRAFVGATNCDGTPSLEATFTTLGECASATSASAGTIYAKITSCNSTHFEKIYYTAAGCGTATATVVGKVGVCESRNFPLGSAVIPILEYVQCPSSSSTVTPGTDKAFAGTATNCQGTPAVDASYNAVGECSSAYSPTLAATLYAKITVCNATNFEKTYYTAAGCGTAASTVSGRVGVCETRNFQLGGTTIPIQEIVTCPSSSSNTVTVPGSDAAWLNNQCTSSAALSAEVPALGQCLSASSSLGPLYTKILSCDATSFRKQWYSDSQCTTADGAEITGTPGACTKGTYTKIPLDYWEKVICPTSQAAGGSGSSTGTSGSTSIINPVQIQSFGATRHCDTRASINVTTSLDTCTRRLENAPGYFKVTRCSGGSYSLSIYQDSTCSSSSGEVSGVAGLCVEDGASGSSYVQCPDGIVGEIDAAAGVVASTITLLAMLAAIIVQYMH